MDAGACASEDIPAANESEPRQPCRVLVVDDDEGVRQALERVLSARGYEVVSAGNGDEALRALEQNDCAVALVDVVMPHLGGPELIPLLHAKNSALQVIMMSGVVNIEAAVRSLKSGAIDFIEKPIRAEVVHRAVESAASHVELGRTAALYKSSQTIFDAKHFEQLPEAIVKVSMQVMRADRVSLLLPAMDGRLYVANAYGLDAEVQNTARITVGEGIAGRVAASGKPTIINGSASDVATFADAVPRIHVKSSIIYPLVSGTRLVGVLTFNRLTAERPYRNLDLEQASVLASQVLLALENLRLARQTAINEKLAAVGQLAAGIAHEINTPIQFIGDAIHFLGTAFEDLGKVVRAYQRVAVDGLAAADEARALEDEVDVDDLFREMPKALQQTLDGIARVTTIVQSIKTFGRPDTRVMEPTDIAKLIRATLTVARSEYKYVADVETELDGLPLVDAHPGEIGQVVLNIVINAAHAITEALRAKPEGSRGKISLRGAYEPPYVVLRITDDGCGIPKENQGKIFDPFFTTKPLGTGTGLGLAIARGIVVDRHGGSLTVESEVGRGSCFEIRLRASAAAN